MGAVVSRPGACQDGAVSRHQAAPGGNVFDRAASTYGTVGPDFFGHFGRRLVDCIAIPRGGRVVDVACGTGAALVPAADAVGAGGLSVGVDLSEAMLRRVDAATDAWSGPPILLACMDAQHLAVRSESFDAVVCSFALGSFPDPLAALGECWRVAQPGGRLGLVVSDRWWWEGDERWSWHGDLLQSMGVPGPVGRFASAEAIDSVLKKTGWELRDLVTESFPMVFSGADEWWAWTWSHGYRQILESMSAAELALYRTECFGQLQQQGQRVLGRLEVSLVCATRP
jgi:O-methyltransferase / aklanonic acid methyltransferase